jgi:hypothetical protein
MNVERKWDTWPASGAVMTINRRRHGSWELHQWATDDPCVGSMTCSTSSVTRRLLVAWRRVRGNKGAPTAGVDGHTARYLAARSYQRVLGSTSPPALTRARSRRCRPGAQTRVNDPIQSVKEFDAASRRDVETSWIELAQQTLERQ